MIEAILHCLIIASMTVTSNNREFSATINYSGDEELAAQSLVLYDRVHEVVYRKQTLRVHTFFITNVGSVFALNEHELHFYDHDGGEIYLQDLEHPNGFGFSVDNSIFFASDKHGIFAYSCQGQLVYKFQPGRLFADADGGNWVAIISTDTLFLYYRGTLKRTNVLSTSYARRVRFSDDSESVIIEIPNGLEVIDVRNDQGVELE